jgi:hypothetical protein
MKYIFIALLLATTLVARAGSDDDSEKMVKSFQQFVPKIIDSYQKRWDDPGHPELARTPHDVRYDIKRTDSVINPFIGVLSFTSGRPRDEQHIYHQISASFSFSNGKWAVIEATDERRIGSSTSPTDVTVNMLLAIRDLEVQSTTRPAVTRPSDSERASRPSDGKEAASRP